MLKQFSLRFSSISILKSVIVLYTFCTQMRSVLLDGTGWFAGLKVPQEPSPKCRVPATCTTSTTTVLAKLLLTKFNSSFTTASSQTVLFLRFPRICIPSVRLEWVVGIGGKQNLGQLFRLSAVLGSRHRKGQSKSN